MEQVRRRVVIDVPREQLWRALTDELGGWFGARVEAPAFRVGAHLKFRWLDGTERVAAVEEVVPEQLLAFRWLPFARAPDGTPVRRDVTRVELTLGEDPDGVALTVVETAMSARAMVSVGGAA